MTNALLRPFAAVILTAGLVGWNPTAWADNGNSPRPPKIRIRPEQSPFQSYLESIRPLHAVTKGEDPADLYFEGWLLQKQGKASLDARNPVAALGQFRESYACFLAVRDRFPNWQNHSVEYRITRLIQELELAFQAARTP